MSRWMNDRVRWVADRWAGYRWDQTPSSPASWQSIYDNTKWVPIDFGVWNVNKWDAEDDLGDWTVDIENIPPWYVNFRPTSVRVTFTGQASIDFELYNDVDFQAGPVTITSLEEIPVTFGASGDFFYIYAISAVGAFSITNIEFFE